MKTLINKKRILKLQLKKKSLQNNNTLPYLIHEILFSVTVHQIHQFIKTINCEYNKKLNIFF